RCIQILSNRVGNAIKFTDRGSVEVDLAYDPLGTHAGLAILKVKDTGIGIKKSAVSGLFQPFGQVDSSVTRRFGGTGLGLVLSRKLAASMGGDVYLESSEPGVGSTFVAKIMVNVKDNVPMCRNIGEVKDWMTDKAATTEVPQEIAGAKVLVVEDSPDIQRIMQLNLERCGVNVALASS